MKSRLLQPAVDTSVLLDIVIPDDTYQQTSRLALNKLAENGRLIISPVVLSEVAVHFKSQENFNSWYSSKPFKLMPDTEEVGWWASRFFRRYIKEKQPPQPRLKILPDFFIAAHAYIHSGSLLTRDNDFQKNYFKELNILTPV
jgi:hypothetical protein